MLTLMLSTLVLALTYGAFWCNQPARRQNDDTGDPGSRLGRLVNRVLEWLVLMPHLSNPAEKKESVFLMEKASYRRGKAGSFDKCSVLSRFGTRVVESAWPVLECDHRDPPIYSNQT